MKKQRMIKSIMNNTYKLTCRSIYDNNTKRSTFKVFDKSKFVFKSKLELLFNK